MPRGLSQAVCLPCVRRPPEAEFRRPTLWGDSRHPELSPAWADQGPSLCEFAKLAFISLGGQSRQ